MPVSTDTSNGGKLPLLWRIVLPIAWLGVGTTAVIAGRDEPSIAYPVAVAVMSWIGLTAVLVVPIAALYGWKWAPALSVVGGAVGLVPSYADWRHPVPSGRLLFALFAGLTCLGLVALRDDRVRDLMRGASGQGPT